MTQFPSEHVPNFLIRCGGREGGLKRGRMEEERERRGNLIEGGRVEEREGRRKMSPSCILFNTIVHSSLCRQNGLHR